MLEYMRLNFYPNRLALTMRMIPPIQQRMLKETDQQFLLHIDPTNRRYKAIYCLVIFSTLLTTIDLVLSTFSDNPNTNATFLIVALLSINILFIIIILIMVGIVFYTKNEKIEISIQKDTQILAIKAYGSQLQGSLSDVISFVVSEKNASRRSPYGGDISFIFFELRVLVKHGTNDVYFKVFESKDRYLSEYFERILEQAVERIKGRTPGTLVSEDFHTQGTQLWKSGDKQGALNAFRSALDVNPYLVQCLFDIGVLLDEMGKTKEAVKYFEKVLKIDNNVLDAWFNLGNACFALKRWNRAVYAFIKVVNINEKDIEAWRNIGKVYENKGDINAAIDAYVKGLEYNPDNAVLKRELNRIRNPIAIG